jgi:Ni/Fe-hydrogenase 1 B-type cytochrome subunit
VSKIILAQVNVWMDVVFTAIYVFMLVAIPIHFLISIPKGRFRNTFILGNWPEHDEPHPPALPKYIHFQHLVMMFVLGFTGMAIRFPFIDGGRTTLRYIHYVAMIIVIATYIWRLWYAFGGKQRDWRAFAITKKDAMSTLGVMAYYAYIKDTKPHTDKYNVMQKFAYLAFAALMAAQAFTGLALLEFWKIPLIDITPSNLMLGWWLAPMVGGLAMAVAWMRIFHYAITWLFIILTTVHVYLSAHIDLPVTKDFFGFGDHGEHDDKAHGHAAPAAHAE